MEGGGGADARAAWPGRRRTAESTAMRGPRRLLCALALALLGAARARAPLCPAPCGCHGDGDRRVDCAGRALAAVPAGLGAFTRAL